MKGTERLEEVNKQAIPKLDRLPNVALTMFDLWLDALRFIGTSLRPRRAPVAESLFLRKQLAFYLERKVRVLLEIQKWLGHKWANSTQFHLDITPTKPANSYRDAGYFARNVRAIDVLIARDVVKNETADREPWMYYDLGRGYCTFDFFELCKFRMVSGQNCPVIEC